MNSAKSTDSLQRGHRPIKLTNVRLKEKQHYRHNDNFDSTGVHTAIGGMFVRNRPKLLKDFEEDNLGLQEQSQMQKYIQSASTFLIKFQKIKENRSPNKQNIFAVTTKNPNVASTNNLYDTKTNFLKSQKSPSPEREKINGVKDFYSNRFLPMNMTSYNSFFRNPWGGAQSSQVSPKIGSPNTTVLISANKAHTLSTSPTLETEAAETVHMKPGFYKSALPKNLNIDYKFMVHNYESELFKYKTPVCIKPRDYDPTGNFRRTHVMTGQRWVRLRDNKVYI